MKTSEAKVAVITGGNKNLGRLLSMDLAMRGASAIILAKDEELNKKTVSEITQKGQKAAALKVDLRDPEEVKKAFTMILAEHGKVDILINNAGISYFESAEKIDEAKVSEMIDVNLRSVYLACKFVLPSMLENGAGTIVNISSIYGLRADKRTAVYSMTKAGLIGYTKGLHADYGENGIRAKVFCPVAFGEDSILDTNTLSRKIVGSVYDLKDHFNEVTILSKKAGTLKILLFIGKRWDRFGRKKIVGYRFKITR